MNPRAERILEALRTVEREREARQGTPGLDARVWTLKAYQQERFRRSYADLLASPRYAGAARFFLDELYGPHDFVARDAQFARIVPAMARLFPGEILETVERLAALHALSEQLDTEMARRLDGPAVRGERYAAAWRATGRPAERERQIALTLQIGESLERYTRRPLLRRTLHLMRGPARAAGLHELQQFLELGFDAFGSMGGAAEFLATIGARERELAAALFEAPARVDGSASALLGQLP